MNWTPERDGASILPHGGYARFVDRVLEYGPGELSCIGRIPDESPFAREGRAPGFVLLELAAQVAAIEVLAKTAGARPRVGYLARARGLNWTAEGVPTGAALEASVRREESLPPLYTFSATVTLAGVEVFDGTFSIYVDEKAY